MRDSNTSSNTTNKQTIYDIRYMFDQTLSLFDRLTIIKRKTHKYSPITTPFIFNTIFTQKTKQKSKTHRYGTYQAQIL